MKLMALRRIVLALGIILTAQTRAAAAGISVVSGTEGVSAASGMNNEFAVDIYKRFTAVLRDRRNILMFPFGASSSLAMISAGARGETGRQLAQVLRLRGEQDERSSVAALLGALKTERSSVDLTSVLWVQKGLGLKKDFVDLAEQAYGFGIHELDFRTERDRAPDSINGWFEKETRGRIKDVIEPASLKAGTNLVLTSAVQFKGVWSSAFDKKDTRSEPFYREDGSEGLGLLMHRTADLPYMEDREVRGVELPYAGDRLSLVVLLPSKPNGLKALEHRLTEKELAAWLGKMTRARVEVYLPKFEMGTQSRLDAILTAMGMTTAFSPQADFSGMSGNRDLYLAAVLQKAILDVDEEGDAASGASATTPQDAAAQEPLSVFRADHPFLFLVRDRVSGSILFIGRYIY